MAGILQIIAAYGGIFLAIYAATYSKQAPLEATNFNITQALVDVGIDPIQIPVGSAGFEQQPLEATCNAACNTLSSWFGSKVSPKGSKGYDAFLDSFGAQQHHDVHPQCVITPTENSEVSATVLLSRLSGCPFAAKSKGHAPSKGSPHFSNGISIWLKEFSEVTLNEDKSIASVGTGLTWAEVYESLRGTNVTVVGDRSAGTGVGEFLLGGGISIHANVYGWGIDNVESFEVVTASGQVITARRRHREDLFQALKGTGNNYGIVTKVNLYTIPDQLVCGGMREYGQTQKFEVIRRFVQTANDASTDGKIQQWLSLMGPTMNNVIRTEQTCLCDGEDNRVFQQYKDISAQRDMTATKDIVQYVKDNDADSQLGKREVSWTASINLSEKFLNWVADYYYTSMNEFPEALGVTPELMFHPVTIRALRAMNKNMGNALGLEASTKPLVIIRLLCTWDDAEKDTAIEEWASSFFRGLQKEAKRWKLNRSFIYMNYANEEQDVIASYGDSNGVRLRRVAEAYDPARVFEKLQKGGFKLRRNARSGHA